MTKRLLIPGTGGCTYSSDDGIAMATVADLIAGDDRHLLVDHDPTALEPTRTSGVPTPSGKPVALRATGHISAVYQPFENSASPGYTIWSYDWRLDMELSARRLIDFLRDSGETWDIACHSQGGLVVCWAAKLAGKPLFQRWVRRIAFVGVPFNGTFGAVSALLGGVSIVGGKCKKQYTRTWPSLYQMMPLWNVGLNSVQSGELFWKATWNRAGLLKPGKVGKDRAKFLDEDLFARAEKYRSARMSNFFAPLAGLRTLIVQGIKYKTMIRAPRFPTLPSASDSTSRARGDERVPADETYRSLPDWFQRQTTTHYIPHVAEHMFMCGELAIFQQCEMFFSSP